MVEEHPIGGANNRKSGWSRNHFGPSETKGGRLNKIKSFACTRLRGLRRLVVSHELRRGSSSECECIESSYQPASQDWLNGILGC